MERDEKLHIGEMVRCEMKRQHKGATWLSQQLVCARTNVYDILGRKVIDLELLVRISIALRHNFLFDVAVMVDEKLQNAENDNVSECL
ncbi:MAG: XRE family transcriptional regulator [Bacteroidales bacterium]|nr:XRE family transcriptional regulator [Bacteroidales bacterium]